MKGLITIIILLNSAFVFGQNAEFSFEKRTHKFPKTKEGITLTHHFEFENKGNSPLIISNYKVACTCTKVIFPKKPIPPNGKDTIEITFDTTNKIGYQDRKVELFSNSKNSPTVLRFKVMVENKGHL